MGLFARLKPRSETKADKFSPGDDVEFIDKEINIRAGIIWAAVGGVSRQNYYIETPDGKVHFVNEAMMRLPQRLNRTGATIELDENATTKEGES